MTSVYKHALSKWCFVWSLHISAYDNFPSLRWLKKATNHTDTRGETVNFATLRITQKQS